MVAATWDIHQPDSLASMSGKSSLCRNTADNVKVTKFEHNRNSQQNIEADSSEHCFTALCVEHGLGGF